MTDLVFWTALSGLYLALAWLPYILNRIAVRGLWGALKTPTGDEPPHSPWAERCKRAHTVAVEAFVAWGPLAALAAVTRPDDPSPGTLAMGFFIGIVGHNISYTFGIPVARTLFFAAAALCSAALALRLIGVL